jgi:LPXTG-site transpeptidase (sortase) family protein
VVLRERLILGLQVAAALFLPFIVYWIDPPNPVLWSVAIFVIVLIFTLFNSYWMWLVLGAIVVTSLPSVFDFGRASDPFMWGCASMSIGVVIATATLQPLPERPMFRTQSASPWPKILAATAVIIAGLAITAFALLFNRSADELFASSQAEAAEFFANAPDQIEGADDGTNPVLNIPQTRAGNPVDVGPVIASLEFKRANGRSVVSRDPLFVREGVDTRTLALGPGRYPTPTKVGEIGNLAIAGHRTGYGYPFKDLDRLEVGDTVTATDIDGTSAVYEVVSVQIVDPTATWVLGPDPLKLGVPTLTLTTCDPPNADDKRLVVFAALP